MPGREFRFSYFTRDYETTISFNRDGLELPIRDSWERSRADRGTNFIAGSGLIEVLHRPATEDAEPLFNPRPPQGAFMVLEVDDVESAYRPAVEKGLPIQKKLSRQSWGHNSFCVREPNGLTIYLFSR